MKTKHLSMLLLSLLSVFIIAGCGGPKKVNNQQMTLHLAYGDRAGTYTGEVNDQNSPNGKGSFTSKNPEGFEWTYEGQFKDGHIEGKGKTTWKNSKKSEEGTYANGLLTGDGKRTYMNNGKSEVYEGNFIAGLPIKNDIAGLNKEVSFADWMYKVTKAEFQNTAGNKQASGKYLYVTLDETNNGQTPRQPGAHNFFIIANKTNGQTYQMDGDAILQYRLASNSYQTPWYLSRVNPGLSVQGILLIFDVPKDVELNNLLLLPRQSMGNVSPVQLGK
jgi:hypothetical protein